MFKKFVILLSLTLLATGLYFYISEGRVLKINTIDVTLSEHQPSSEEYYSGLKEALEQEFKGYIGLPLWELPLTDLSNLLKNISWVRQFSISRSLLGQVSVQLQPEQIALLWAKTDGTLLPLSNRGKVLEPIDLIAAPDLPILRSKEFTGEAEQAIMAAELISSIRESPFLAPTNIKEVSYNKSGFSFELFEPEVVVKMGVPPYSTKVQRVEKVIQYLQRKGLKSRVIDATFSKKVLVRARKGPYAD